MKKIFTLFALAAMAVSVSATTIWSETFDRNGTYVQRTSNAKWPYADQWFTGYTGEDGEVKGSLYSEDYGNVTSFNVSIRGKKVDGGTTSVPGLFFAVNKKDTVTFTGMNVEVPAGYNFYLTFSNTENTTKLNCNVLTVKVNGTALSMPSVETTAQATTTTATIALPAQTITSLQIIMGSQANALFISKMTISDGATALNNVYSNETKAVKTIENGQVVVIRNGVRYNLMGAVVE